MSCSTLLSLPLVLLALAACSPGGDSPGGSAPDAAPEAASEAAQDSAPLTTETVQTPDPVLQEMVAGDWRKAANRDRDTWRHPAESLTFWGLRPGMTVLEVQPGGGWWTEILAPYAHATDGAYYATAVDLEHPETDDAARQARQRWAARWSEKPEVFGDIQLVNWGPRSAPLPAETFDLALVDLRFAEASTTLKKPIIISSQVWSPHVTLTVGSGLVRFSVELSKWATQ